MDPHSTSTQPVHVRNTTTRHEAIATPARTQARPDTRHDPRPVYRAIKIVWYLLAVIESLLALRLALRLLGANEAAAFTQFVYGLSGIFLAPFQFVFNTMAVGRFALELSTLLAMFVYWLIAWGIVRLILLPRTVESTHAERVIEEHDTQ